LKLGAKRIIIAARRVKELERVKQESGKPDCVSIVQIDLNEPRKVLEILAPIFKEFTPDILINNGGISMREEFKNLDFSVCETMVNTNLLSHIAATKAALPEMMVKGTGHIVNVISGSGIVGLPVRTMYSASKFGLSGFGNALRSEVKLNGIQVL
jgi:dehydrogenase/reductase SDR family protein 7B